MAGYNIPDTFNQKDSLRSRGQGTGGPTPGAGGASSSMGASVGRTGSRGNAARDIIAQLARGPAANRGMKTMPVGRTPKAAPAPTKGRSMPPKAPTMPGPAKEVQAFQQGPRGPRRGS